MYDIAQHYRILHSVCHNINSKFRTISIFKSSVKNNDYSNKTCRYIHGLSLYQLQLSNHNGPRVTSIKQNVNF
jgi:hypothetical protein